MATNKVIHFDGIDGAGKTAILQALKDRYGYKVYREPGGTAIGEYLRQNVLYNKSYSAVTKRLMYALSRCALQDHLVTDMDTPVSLVDRSAVSSLVYDMGIDMSAHITAYQTLEINFPDHIIHVKVTPETALKRLLQRPQGLRDETIFLEEYIEQQLLPPNSTVLTMLQTLATRYDTAFQVIHENRLVQYQQLSVDNEGDLAPAVDAAAAIIQQILSGDNP